MHTKQALGLFIIPSLIWGSTWFAITFQLGTVDPILSVAYRSGLAGIILLIFSVLTNRNLRYSTHDHFFLFLQGFFLYGVNYWFVYLAESKITSGLVAIVFSLVVILNVIFGSLFLKIAVKRKLVVAAVIGLLGTIIIFIPELQGLELNGGYLKALFISLFGVILASLGNIVATYNHRNNIPIIQTNAYGMVYGSASLLIIALFQGTQLRFDFTFPYISSLLYLAVFGSIIAFNTYLKLLSLWGPGKAAYIVLVTPVIAVIISYFFENYQISMFTIIGAALVLFGNYLAVKK